MANIPGLGPRFFSAPSVNGLELAPNPFLAPLREDGRSPPPTGL